MKITDMLSDFFTGSTDSKRYDRAVRNLEAMVSLIKKDIAGHAKNGPDDVDEKGEPDDRRASSTALCDRH